MADSLAAVVRGFLTKSISMSLPTDTMSQTVSKLKSILKPLLTAKVAVGLDHRAKSLSHTEAK